MAKSVKAGRRRAPNPPMAESGRDTLFATTAARASDFEFNAQVAGVFDDMVKRSVPFYLELQYMVVELAKHFWVTGGRVYDLGCATATTLINLCRAIEDPTARFIGYDNSEAMLTKARDKVRQHGLEDRIELVPGDLLDPVPIDAASLVTMCWTLQFIRPPERLRLVQHIYRGLRPGGLLLVIDKVMASHPITNRAFVELYYEFKRRNGYSDQEIARKREALENVLIPYRIDENLALFRDAGFPVVEPFFQWYNFAGFLCVKT